MTRLVVWWSHLTEQNSSPCQRHTSLVGIVEMCALGQHSRPKSSVSKIASGLFGSQRTWRSSGSTRSATVESYREDATS
jgi:hypothetical protein